MARLAASAPRLAIVGGETLAGRELSDLLSEKRLAAALELVMGSDAEEIVADEDEDAISMKPLKRESLSNARLIFLAGSAAASRKVAGMKLSALLVDLTGAVATVPGAVLRAPMAEPERFLAADTKLAWVAHPAAIALAMVIRRLQSVAQIRQAIATVLEPASQRGRAAIEELQQQTVGLLGAKSFPKDVFDDQLSFNMLSRLGIDAPESLAAAQSAIQRDLGSLLGAPPPITAPSIRLIHAPVFHAHAISLWVDFESRQDLGKLAAFLKSPQIDVRSADEEAPTNVGVAGQSGVTVDTLQPDAINENAIWVWIVADNIRLSADNAVLVAASMLEQSERPLQ